MKKGIIRIEDMKFYAYHGCFDKEKVVGTPFAVSVRMEYDASKAMESDDIDDALNYQKAYELIAEEMQETSNLLEHVAQRILNCLYDNFSELCFARVQVKKIAPPMGGEMSNVSLTLER
ncbi:dihydroneopterin aldolase [Balneicella halophila]|uniref:7,8-dihydroneopterin aldolase n=2 Tax=Balneicella halophila TaxID=1537566 RepID=A0A7L4USJ7_BALHA|nr:dihydroneopterin aldolase [Balneicella halophila]